MSVNPAFDELMSLRQGKPPGERIESRGTDPVLPTPFALGETNSAILLAVGVAVNDLWELKTGDRQNLSIGVREAAAARQLEADMEEAKQRQLEAGGEVKPLAGVQLQLRFGGDEVMKINA